MFGRPRSRHKLVVVLQRGREVERIWSLPKPNPDDLVSLLAFAVSSLAPQPCWGEMFVPRALEMQENLTSYVITQKLSIVCDLYGFSATLPTGWRH